MPNPAPGGLVRFHYAAGKPATVTVWNAAGYRAAVLSDPTGRGEVTWDTKNAADGTYFYRVMIAGTVPAGTQVLVVQR